MPLSAGVIRIIEDVRKVFNYVRKEYDVNYAEAIGALRIITRDLEDEMISIRDDDDDNNDDTTDGDWRT